VSNHRTTTACQAACENQVCSRGVYQWTGMDYWNGLLDGSLTRLGVCPGVQRGQGHMHISFNVGGCLNPCAWTGTERRIW